MTLKSIVLRDLYQQVGQEFEHLAVCRASEVILRVWCAQNILCAARMREGR